MEYNIILFYLLLDPHHQMICLKRPPIKAVWSCTPATLRCLHPNIQSSFSSPLHNTFRSYLQLQLEGHLTDIPCVLWTVVNRRSWKCMTVMHSWERNSAGNEQSSNTHTTVYSSIYIIIRPNSIPSFQSSKGADPIPFHPHQK